MKGFYSFIFSMITDPLGLPMDWQDELVIMLTIGAVAFTIAYQAVGRLYSDGWISGREEGSFLHWTIRLVVFVGLWGVAYATIWIAKQVMLYKDIIALILGGIAIIAWGIYLYIRCKREGGDNHA